MRSVVAANVIQNTKDATRARECKRPFRGDTKLTGLLFLYKCKTKYAVSQISI